MYCCVADTTVCYVVLLGYVACCTLGALSGNLKHEEGRSTCDETETYLKMPNAPRGGQRDTKRVLHTCCNGNIIHFGHCAS